MQRRENRQNLTHWLGLGAVKGTPAYSVTLQTDSQKDAEREREREREKERHTDRQTEEKEREREREREKVCCCCFFLTDGDQTVNLFV